MTRYRGVWALVPAMSLVLGCSGSVEGPTIGETVSCDGTVLLDGKPVAGAIVSFQPKTNTGYWASGLTDEAGKYSLETDLKNGKTKKGVLPGKYNVTVSRMVNKEGNPIKVDPNAPPMDIDPTAREGIPMRYSSVNEMGLYYDVPPAGGSYPIEMTSAEG